LVFVKGYGSKHAKYNGGEVAYTLVSFVGSKNFLGIIANGLIEKALGPHVHKAFAHDHAGRLAKV